MTEKGKPKQEIDSIDAELLEFMRPFEATTSETPKLKEGERRMVTVLFADIKGFTALSEQLDHEHVFKFTDKIMKVFTKIIDHYGGYVDKYEGDSVMALFGANTATEQDTERAVRAGLKMIDILEPFNRILTDHYPELSGIQLDVRIGINTGLVTTGKIGKERDGDFTAIGDTVNLASRMESNAPVHSIMLNSSTKKVVENIFVFTDHGEIKVKGKSRPVAVYLVDGLKARAIRRWEVHSSAYVGRDKEMNILRSTFGIVDKRIRDSKKQTEKEKPIVVGIKGIAGIGKSRLLYEFLQDKNNFVLHGTTPSISQNPNCVFTSMIRQYFEVTVLDTLKESRRKLEGGITELKTHCNEDEKKSLDYALPMLGYLLNIKYEDIRFDLEPKDLKVHIQISIRHLLEAIAKKANNEKKPLIVILEDLHWLDEVSQSTINFLFQTLNLEEKRTDRKLKHFMFILAYRPGYDIPEEIGFSADFTEIELNPLQETDAEILIDSIASNIKLSEKVKTLLMARSDGNPFYIEEWVQLVKDMPDKGELPIPDTLNALIISRIDRLEHELKLLLRKAAVVGRAFFVKVLTEIEKKLNNTEDITDHLRLLETSNFIIEDIEKKFSSYFFKHIITREVAYSTMLIENRKTLHRLTAEVIEEQFEELSEFYYDLAIHYEKAENTEKAIEYLEKAGGKAKEEYQIEKAVDCYTMQLCMLEEDDDESSRSDFKSLVVNTKLKRGDVLELIGKWDDAITDIETALTLAEELDDKELIAKAVQKMGMMHLKKGDYEKAMKCYEKALKIDEELGDKREISRHVANMGIVYL